MHFHSKTPNIFPIKELQKIQIKIKDITIPTMSHKLPKLLTTKTKSLQKNKGKFLNKNLDDKEQNKNINSNFYPKTCKI